MKMLLTGANGQVAFELLRLFKHPFSLYAFSKEQLNIANLNDVLHIMRSIQPDIVMNAAAYTQVDKAETEIESALVVNRDGAKNLAIACQDMDSQLIHLSTDYVFDGKQSHPYQETDVISPVNQYGQSKWEGEETIRQTCEKHLIIRVSGVFGVHGHNFVKTILRLAQEKKQLRIVNDQITCPTAAQDIATMLKELCVKAANVSAWGTYHYCSANPVNWYQFAEHILRDYPKTIEAILSHDYPTLAKRPMYSVLNCQKINTIFNIQQPNWQKGLDHVLNELSTT